MRLLNVQSFEFRDFPANKVPKYAIASHRWSTDGEVTFQDVRSLRRTEEIGFKKVKGFAQYVKENIPQVGWLWIDTCCINKESAAEVSEAFNSMFEWYANAEVCLAYLADVDLSDHLIKFKYSKWFYRGWTLLELLAPRKVVFLTQGWDVIGHKGRTTGGKSGIHLYSGPSLIPAITVITGIPEAVLIDYNKSRYLSIEERLKWAANRQTTWPEDMSYCLLGIFDIKMPLVYGEGHEHARERLLAAIDRATRKPSSNPPFTAIDRAIRKPSSNIPFRRDPNFVLRDTLMHEIRGKFAIRRSQVALVGRAGAGKSHLAIEYAYRIRKQRPETWVFWINASNTARFEQGMRDAADLIQIEGREDPKADVSKLVYNWLHDSKEKWMVVLDHVNAESAGFLSRPFIASPRMHGISYRNSFLIEGSQGLVLLTCRSYIDALKLGVSDLIIVDPIYQGDYDADSEDVSSIFSEISYASSVTSAGIQPISDELINDFVRSVFCNENLLHIHSAALHDPDVGNRRFTRKIRRLIVKFGSGLKSEAHTMQEISARRALQYKSVSQRTARSIAEHLEIKGNNIQQSSTTDTQVFSPQLMNHENFGELIDDRNETSESSDGEEVDEGDDTGFEEQAFHAVRSFMLGSEAYSVFKTELLRLAHESYQKRIMAALKNDVARVPNWATSERGLSAVALELSWVPPNIFHFSTEEHRTVLNTVEEWIEGSMGEPWNWWPLPQTMPKLRSQYVRLSWRSPCGHNRSTDLPAITAIKFEEVLKSAPAYLYSQGMTPHSSKGPISALGGTDARDGQPALERSTPTQQSTASSSQHNIQQPAPATHYYAAGQRDAGSGRRTQVSHQVLPATLRHIYVCIKRGGKNHVFSFRTDPMRTDKEFFAKFKSQYLNARGIVGKLSMWQYDHCQFFKFHKYGVDRCGLLHIDFPPTSETDYDFEPRPPEPLPPYGPITDEEFRDSFYNTCYPCLPWHYHQPGTLLDASGTSCLKSLPKRKTAIQLQQGQREVFWGLYAVEHLCFLRVFAYGCLFNFPGVLFFFLWLFRWEHASDLQDASVPIQLSLSLTLCFLGMVWATGEGNRKGLN